MNTLGNRIRSLRKKRKLTLEALAGEQMTKGMLSLIENDKAQPSMESLAYIAQRLDIGVNELLERVSTSELREIVQHAEIDFKAEKYEEVQKKLDPFIEEELPEVYESAKLLELYGKAGYFTKEAEWATFIDMAEKIYLELKLYNPCAKLSLFLVWATMNTYDYTFALEQLRQKRALFQELQADLDILNEIDFMWVEVGLLFACDQYEEASEQLKQAISFSKEKNVFYKIEELYRLAWLHALLNKREEDMTFYLNKLALFADFTESKFSHINVKALRIVYYNSYLNQYDKAIELVEELYAYLNEEEQQRLNYFYVQEKGKALFGKKQYQQALHYLLQYEEQEEWHHPFDLVVMYEVYAYIARCYLELGKHEEAYTNAKYAMDHVSNFPDTPFKAFIKETMVLASKTREKGYNP